MVNLICNNPEIIMNGAAFGIISWLLIFLFVCITFILRTPPKPFTRNSKLACVTGLTSVFLIYLALSGQSQAKKALESGKHDTIVGSVEKINTIKRKTSRGATYSSTIELRLSGVVQSQDGEISEISPANDKQAIKSEKLSFVSAGKLCRGNTCGLKVGDKVKILAQYSNWYGKPTFHSYVPFHIEKCGP